MLNDNMNISRLMLHAHQVEETMLRGTCIEEKETKSYNGGSSKGRIHIQEKPRLKKEVYLRMCIDYHHLNKVNINTKNLVA